MADDVEIEETTEAAPLDLGSFVPETFKTEDGGYDTAAFRTRFDELAAEKAAADERAAALPQKPEEYAFALAEDHQFPEGFDAKALGYVNENGEQVEFDPASLLSSDDPDVKMAQAILHEIKAPSDVAAKLAGLMVNRELRSVMEASKVAAAEKAKLGPDAKTRIDVMTRTLQASLPKEQAKALLDGVTSADALRGLEAIVHKVKAQIPAQSAPPNPNDLPPMERLLAGLNQRKRA